MGKILKIKGCDISLNMRHSISVFISQFYFYGRADVHFNSGLTISSIPFDIDCITGQPHVSYYYDIDTLKKKYPKHYMLITKKLFPYMSKYIQELFKNKIDTRVKNIDVAPDIIHFDIELGVEDKFDE